MSKRLYGTIRRLPSGRWQARYRHPSTGLMVPAPITFDRKGDAARWLASAETDQNRGVFIEPSQAKTTLAEWAALWLDGDPRKRRSSRARDDAALRVHILPALGARRLSSVTPLDVRRLVEAMSVSLAPATVHRNMDTVSALFNSAVEADLLTRSPVRGVKLPAVRPPSRPTLTIAQLLRLSESVPARYGALILVGGVLGLRWGEAIGLRVRDIDFLRRTITVAQEVSEVTGHLAIEPPKTARSVRTLAVPAFVIEATTAHLVTHRGPVEPDDLVFVGPKGGVLRRAFEQRTFKPAVASAGLPPTLTFHGLRHVAATLMVANNEHPRVIQHRLGHTDPTLSMGLYAHVPDDADRAAADHLQRLLADLHEGRRKSPTDRQRDSGG